MQTYNLNTLRAQLNNLNVDSRKMAYENEFALFDNITEISLKHTPTRLEMGVFGLCLEGSGHVEVDTRIFEFHAGSYITLLPNQVVNLPEGQHGNGIFICVSKRMADELVHRMQEMLPMFFYIRENPCAQLSEQDVEWIKKYHEQVFRELQDTSNMFRRETARALLVALLYKVCNIYGAQIIEQQPTGNRKEEIFTQFLKILSDNFRQHRDVAWYAEQMYVTPKYMSTVVKQVSGQSANEWIQNYVIQEAKLLLKTSKLSIQQIAYQLNFPSQSFFGKYFKHATGVSPSNYRSSI